MNRKVLLGDPPAIQITNSDFGRLDMFLANLGGKANTRALEFLRDELDRARLVDEAKIAAPFVRIGSRVLFGDERGKTYRLTLLFPGEKSSGPSQISIVTPVGAALLGLSEGQSITYETPDYRVKTVTVLKVSEGQ